MSRRSDFITIKAISSARNGGNNQGVYVVKSIRSGNKYIEKRVRKEHIQVGHGEREARAMRQCGAKHPNIIALVLCDLNYEFLGYGSLFMQHCELGSLDGVIGRYNARGEVLNDEGFLYKILWDIALALSFLSTGVDAATTRNLAKAGYIVGKKSGWNQTLHRDLKPGNIFLTWKNPLPADRCLYPTAVLGDFGCSVTQWDVRTGNAKWKFHSGVTPDFEPPESPRYHEHGDIYMLGLSIHCLAMMRNRPRSVKKERERRPLQGFFGDRCLGKLLMLCLECDPEDRPFPGELPLLVMGCYRKWRAMRRDDGQRLSGWAYA